ncbi:hypothetical protein AAMO2058_000250800 [Amorphochlora amoebiformis]
MDVKGTAKPYYILVGGECHEIQGVMPRSKRELMHTSLTYVASAYDKLREAGVAREQIITIVQLEDYLLGLKDGGYPKSMYLKECARLIKEGGPDYDFDMVNPETIWNVLLGLKSKDYPKVVPKDKGTVKSLTVAIYSHGDSHPAVRVKTETKKDTKQDTTEKNAKELIGPAKRKPYLHPLKHEWFVHMPYPSKTKVGKNMLEFVATDGSVGAGKTREKPLCYLYATQIRAIFVKLFTEFPKTPVICLLNYCRSGGGIEFLRRPNTRKLLGANDWPLFVMSSCQAHHDALVGGLWDTFFFNLANSIAALPKEKDKTLNDLFFISKRDYHRRNRYELKDIVKTLAFPSIFAESKDVNAVAVRYDTDLANVVCASKDGSPDFDKVRKMQEQYKDGTRWSGKKVVFYHPNDWKGEEVDLVEAVKEAQNRSAIPEALQGSSSTGKFTISDVYQVEK